MDGLKKFIKRIILNKYWVTHSHQSWIRIRSGSVGENFTSESSNKVQLQPNPDPQHSFNDKYWELAILPWALITVIV
jgi:hypothetical protein